MCSLALVGLFWPPPRGTRPDRPARPASARPTPRGRAGKPGASRRLGATSMGHNTRPSLHEVPLSVTSDFVHDSAGLEAQRFGQDDCMREVSWDDVQQGRSRRARAASFAPRNELVAHRPRPRVETRATKSALSVRRSGHS